MGQEWDKTRDLERILLEREMALRQGRGPRYGIEGVDDNGSTAIFGGRLPSMKNMFTRTIPAAWRHAKSAFNGEPTVGDLGLSDYDQKWLMANPNADFSDRGVTVMRDASNGVQEMPSVEQMQDAAGLQELSVESSYVPQARNADLPMIKQVGTPVAAMMNDIDMQDISDSWGIPEGETHASEPAPRADFMVGKKGPGRRRGKRQSTPEQKEKARRIGRGAAGKVTEGLDF